MCAIHPVVATWQSQTLMRGVPAAPGTAVYIGHAGDPASMAVERAPTGGSPRRPPDPATWKVGAGDVLLAPRSRGAAYAGPRRRLGRARPPRPRGRAPVRFGVAAEHAQPDAWPVCAAGVASRVTAHATTEALGTTVAATRTRARWSAELLSACLLPHPPLDRAAPAQQWTESNPGTPQFISHHVYGGAVLGPLGSVPGAALTSSPCIWWWPGPGVWEAVLAGTCLQV